MKLYELIQPSDKITFYADDDKIAREVTLLLGAGKAGCRKQNGEQLSHCFTAFGTPAPKEVYEELNKHIEESNQNLINSLNSVACCSFSEREIYDDYTNKSTDEDKMFKWNENHRTSINNFCSHAKYIARVLTIKRMDSKWLNTR